MSSERLSEVFDDCLVRLAAGATVEQCLRDYPGDGDRLRPLLETVTLMRRALPPASEVIGAQDRVRATMMAAMQSNPVSSRQRTAAPRRWIGALASAAVLIFALMGVLGYAAEGALPGDVLYPVKLVSEAARLAVIHDPALAAAFTHRRVIEVKRVLADGRQVHVRFFGRVDRIDGNQWQVDGVPVEIAATTIMKSTIRPGDDVEVEGFASASVVHAEEIEKASTDESLPPAPVKTPESTPESTSDPSATPAPSVTPRPSATTRPSATPAPSSINLTTIPRVVETLVVPTTTPEGSCTLTVPADWVSYSVRAGDTTSELAAKTSITLDTLLTVNCLTDARLLVVGQQIYLPFTPPTAAPKPTSMQQASGSQPSSNGGSTTVDAGGSTPGSGSGSSGQGGDNSGSGSSNSGSEGSGSGDSGSGGSDNSGSGSSNSGSGGSGDSGSGGSDDGGSSGSDDGGSSGHGNDDGGGGGHGSDDGND